MSTNHYILDADGQPKQVDLMTWAAWYEGAERHVANSYPAEGIHVSTVFLGLDHNWGDGPPILFETMIFGGANDQYQELYCTQKEALEGHKKALQIAVGPAIDLAGGVAGETTK